MDYDLTPVPAVYQDTRRLPDETMRLWMDAIGRHVIIQNGGSILDLGCGTGRFSAALAESFSVDVIGVDPSQEMLKRARPSAKIDFRAGRAEQIPLSDGEVELVFMSMMYHHIEDLDAAVGEFDRVLANGGQVCIRNSTLDSMDDCPYVAHFPASRELCQTLLPSIADIDVRFSKQGFRVVAQEVITQPTAPSPSAYVEKVGRRVYSDLNLISDEEFATGFERLKSAMAALAPDEVIYEDVDLLVYSKSARATGGRTTA